MIRVLLDKKERDITISVENDNIMSGVNIVATVDGESRYYICKIDKHGILLFGALDDAFGDDLKTDSDGYVSIDYSH